MKLYTFLAVKLLFLCFLVFGSPFPEEKNGMSHSPSIEQRSPQPIVQAGRSVQTTYYTSKGYVVALFQDKSESVVITFEMGQGDPFTFIKDALDEHFNRRDKSSGVEVFLILGGADMKDPQSNAVGKAFLAMLNQIVLFRVDAHGILLAATNQFVNGAVLKLNMNPQFPLVIGNRGHALGPSK
jgi:hypothetical protein